MVAKVISGKNIRGVLNYNENKVQGGTAVCIMASRFGCDPKYLTFSNKVNRFTKATSLNPKVRTNAIHISLNFDPTEKLADEKLNAIALNYMERIGFGEQPFLVYRHNDAAHPHIHIVTTNIKRDGKRIDIHNIGRNESEIARKEIELLFGLVRAESRQKNMESIVPMDIERAAYGKSETKRSISNIVRSVVRQYKYTSLPELNAVLRQFNVIADPGPEGSLMRRKSGLLYSMIDAKGQRVGVPIKASTIYGKPTRSFLENQYRLNEVMRSPFKDRMKQVIEQALKKSASRADFVHLMSKHDVFILFRENAQSRVYGITFVDNKNKVVFNGSDLGKSYSASAILNRLENSDQSRFSPAETKSNSEKDRPMTVDLGIQQMIDDLLTAQASDFASPDAAMKRKKRKKRKGRSI